MKVKVYPYNEDSRFGIRYAVRSISSMFATENEMAWKLFNAPNNWGSEDDARKWCVENGYETI